MSVPSTGKFVASLAGESVTFNGETWSGPADARFALRMRALELQTPLHVGTHIDAAEAARKILDSLFPGEWSETEAITDAWSDPLPEGAID